jgi:LemA protein
VRSFPTNIFAGIMGFKPRTGFTADAGSERAPNVDFGDQQKAPSTNFDSTKK